MARGNTREADVEQVDETGPEATADAPAEKAKKKAEPARGDLPEGYVTPIGLAKELGKRGLQKDRQGNTLTEVRPQMVYSYMRNASKNDPFPIENVKDSIGKERQALKLSAGIEWWERKNKRVAERAQNAATKAAKKAEKAAASENAEGDQGTEPATEAE